MSGRRRRSNLGRNTVYARKARSARDKESSTEREARLSRLRDRYRVKRARETSVEREIRLSQERDRTRRARERRRRINLHPKPPKDEILRNRWMNIIKKEMDYVNYAKRILRKNTVPTMIPLLDRERADMSVVEIKIERDFDETNCESDIEMVPDEQVETIKVEETQQQQQQSPSSLLIELLPLSFPQTSQAPLAIQPTQLIQPIQENGILFCRRTPNK